MKYIDILFIKEVERERKKEWERVYVRKINRWEDRKMVKEIEIEEKREKVRETKKH